MSVLHVLRANLSGVRHFPIALELGPGLHVVHGPNEAGKSTSRNALELLLFPEASREGAFRTATLSGVMQSPEGEVVVEIRRGRLVAPEVDVLRRLVGGAAERTLFKALFCLGHAEVGEGHTLLGERGAVGRILLQVETGGSALARLQEHVRKDLDALFSPAAQAKNPVLNALVREAQELEGKMQQRKLGGHYDRARNTLEQLRAEREAADRDLRDLRESLRALERLREQLGPLAERARASDELARVRGEGPTWPTTTLREMEELVQQWKGAVATLKEREKQFERLVGELGKLPPESRVLLAEKPNVRDLGARLTVYRSSKRAMQEDALAVIQYRDFLRAELASQGLDASEEVLVERAKALCLDESITKTIRLRIEAVRKKDDEVERLGAEEAELERELAVLRAQDLPEPKALAELEVALEHRGPALQECESKRLEHESAVTKLSRSVKTLLLQLGFDPSEATTDFLDERRIPASQDVRARAEELREAHRELRGAESEAKKAEEVVNQTRVALDEANRQRGAALDAEQLRALRDDRDRALDEAQRDPSLKTFTVLKERIRGTDDAGDVRFAKATEVERFERATKELREANATLAREMDRVMAARRKADALSASWQRELAVVPALTEDPNKADEALVMLDALRAALDSWRDVEESRTRFEAEIAGAEDALRDVLAASGMDRPVVGRGALRQLALKRRDELRGMDQVARAHVDEIRRREGDRIRISKGLGRSSREALSAREALDQIESLPPAARRDVNAAERWLDLGTTWRQAIARIDGQERAETEVRAFDADVAGLLSRLAEAGGRFAEFTHLDPDEAVEQLTSRIDHALEDVKAREVLLEEKQRAEALLETARAVLQPLAERVDARAAELRIDKDQLDAALERSREASNLEKAIGQLESQVRHATSMAADAVAEALGGRSDDALRVEEEALRARAFEQEEAVRQATESEGRARSSLEALSDGDASDADLAFRRRAKQEELERRARETVTKSLVSWVVERLEARRREQAAEHPVLVQAGKLLSELTEGRYVAVELEGARGESLVAINGLGAKVAVDTLSDGTRDQLYFALRLAGVVHHVEHGSTHAWPLVLDDVLVHFDDARAKAGMKVLRRITAETGLQVILFTHHAHIAQMARELSAGKEAGSARPPITIHTLDPSPLLTGSVAAPEPAPARASSGSRRQTDDAAVEALAQRICAVLEGNEDGLLKREIANKLQSESERLDEGLLDRVLERMRNAEAGGARIRTTGQKRGMRYLLAD